MSELDRYRGAIAQIFADQEAKRTLGTGIAISDQGYVLTCWHVVQSQGVLLQEVYVRFADQGRIRLAKVLGEHAAEELDYVILKVEGQAPRPIPFGRGKPSGRFYSFGYRKDELADGLAASGEILTHTRLTRKRVPRIQIKSADIEHGMSGAPVWSELESKVIGLISESYFSRGSSKDAELAFAVPIEEILQREGEGGKAVGLVIVLRQRPRNPFTQRGVIINPDLFIGRQRDLEAISHFINRKQGVAIVGDAQIGKSSLLRRLYENYKASPNQFTAFIDMYRITSEEHFFRWIGQSVEREIANGEQFDAWAIDERKLLLFIDDYHFMARRMIETAKYLRGLGQAPNKVIVVTSALPMPHLYPAHEYGQSNPSTIFRDYTLMGLGIIEVQELAEKYLTETGITFTDQELEQSLDKSGGSPYLLQKEFESLFETKIREEE